MTVSTKEIYITNKYLKTPTKFTVEIIQYSKGEFSFLIKDINNKTLVSEEKHNAWSETDTLETVFDYATNLFSHPEVQEILKNDGYI